MRNSNSVNFITLLSEVFEVIDIKSRLLDALDNNEQTSDQRHTLFYDACEKISTLEHENKKMRECIDGIIFSYRFMTGFGENEGFLQDGFRERLDKANKLINGE